jgi:hypothetical protein
MRRLSIDGKSISTSCSNGETESFIIEMNDSFDDREVMGLTKN